MIEPSCQDCLRSITECSCDEGTAEIWRVLRDEQKARRAERLPARQEEILALAVHGYEVRQLTAYQFRVDNALDLYPTHKRFHVLMSGKRGSYQAALSVAKKFLGAPEEKSGRLEGRDGRAKPEREGHVSSS